MPDADAPQFAPSLADLLFARDPVGGWADGYGLDRVTDRVRADLEELLNTRLTYPDLPPEYAPLRQSILAYGLPDLSGYDVGVDGPRAELARVVQAVVERFEPRLRRVRVQVDREGGKLMAVRFRIEAELAAAPADRVGFETVVELTSGKARVELPKDGR